MVAHHLRSLRDESRRALQPGLHQDDREALELGRVHERDRLGVGRASRLLVEHARMDHHLGGGLGGNVRAAPDQRQPGSSGALGRVAERVVHEHIHSLSLLDPAGVEHVTAEPAGLGEAGLRRRVGRVEAHPDHAAFADRGEPACEALFGR